MLPQSLENHLRTAHYCQVHGATLGDKARLLEYLNVVLSRDAGGNFSEAAEPDLNCPSLDLTINGEARRRLSGTHDMNRDLEMRNN